jgi:hypothetical protein
MTAKSIGWRLAEGLVVVAVAVALIEAASFGALFYSDQLPQAAPAARPQVYEAVLVAGRDAISTRKNMRQRWVTSDFDVQIATNASGYRENFEFKPSDLEVAFMGDSFAFGHGVEVDDRFSNVFAARSQAILAANKVASLSYKNGFQPEHYEYFLRKNPDIRPRFIVISLYLGNDLESDVRETSFNRQDLSLELPYRRIENGVVVNNTPFRIPYFQHLMRISYFFRLMAILVNQSTFREHFFQTDGVLPNTPNSEALEFGTLNGYAARAFDALVAIRDLAAAWNGRVMVVLIPQNFYLGALTNPHIRPQLVSMIPEILRTGGLRAAVREKCEAVRLECIDTTDILVAGDYYRLDPHWNKSGHHKVGEMLFRYFLQNGYL